MRPRDLFYVLDLIVALFDVTFLTAKVVIARMAGVGNGLEARGRGLSDFYYPDACLERQSKIMNPIGITGKEVDIRIRTVVIEFRFLRLCELLCIFRLTNTQYLEDVRSK
jgi:hypothetical protein